MNESSSPGPNQQISMSGTSIEGQVGQAEGDLIQVQGKVINLTVYDRIPHELNLSAPSIVKPLKSQEYRQRKVLLNKVKEYWLKGVLEKSLHSKALIELGLEEQLDQVQRPFTEVDEFPAVSRQSLPQGISVTTVFNQMEAGRTLLILGEPGSGKTTMLLKLTQNLVIHTGEDLSRPIPIVMNLSSWAKKRQSIAQWLIRDLYDLYQISKSLGKVWIKEQQLLLLLDGLDEVEAQYRNECVHALNQFIQEHGQTDLVVCSRIRDYEALSERLKLRSAIYVQPLTTQQINQFLEQVGEPLGALKTVLNQNAELQAFATSPLILSVMSLAYQDCSEEAVLQLESAEEQQKHLFDTYIERMFQRRGTTQQYSKVLVLSWLVWLAQRMVQAAQTEFLIERMQPSWLANRKQKRRYRLFFLLIYTLIFGLGVGAIDSFYISWIIGLIAGIVVGLDEEIKPIETLHWSWNKIDREFLRKLVPGIILGFFGGASALLLVRIAFEIDDPINLMDIIYVATCGLIGGLISGLTSVFTGGDIKTRTFPNQGIWRSLANAGLFGLLIGLFSGLISSLLLGLIYEPVVGVLLGLIVGLGFVVIAGLGAGGKACIQHFSLRCVCYLNGYIPWNYARFLSYAVDRIFLQKVGGGYIFVHRLLMEHFAAMDIQHKQNKT